MQNFNKSDESQKRKCMERMLNLKFMINYHNEIIKGIIQGKEKIDDTIKNFDGLISYEIFFEDDMYYSGLKYPGYKISDDQSSLLKYQDMASYLVTGTTSRGIKNMSATKGDVSDSSRIGIRRKHFSTSSILFALYGLAMNTYDKKPTRSYLKGEEAKIERYNDMFDISYHTLGYLATSSQKGGLLSKYKNDFNNFNNQQDGGALWAAASIGAVAQTPGIKTRYDFDEEEWNKIITKGNFIHSKDLCDIIRLLKENISTNLDIEAQEKIEGIIDTLLSHMDELNDMIDDFHESGIELLLKKLDSYFGSMPQRKIKKLINEFNSLPKEEQEEAMEKFEESFKMFNQLNDKEKEFSKKLDGLLKVYTLGNPEELGLNFLNDEAKRDYSLKVFLIIKNHLRP